MPLRYSDTWIDRSLVTDPDWIEYADVPSRLASRARYEGLLGALEELWRETNDRRVACAAMAWTSVHNQLTRQWLTEAMTETLAEICPPETRDAAAALVRSLFPPEDQARVEETLRALRLSGEPH